MKGNNGSPRLCKDPLKCVFLAFCSLKFLPWPSKWSLNSLQKPKNWCNIFLSLRGFLHFVEVSPPSCWQDISPVSELTKFSIYSCTHTCLNLSLLGTQVGLIKCFAFLSTQSSLYSALPLFTQMTNEVSQDSDKLKISDIKVLHFSPSQPHNNISCLLFSAFQNICPTFSCLEMGDTFTHFMDCF